MTMINLCLLVNKPIIILYGIILLCSISLINCGNSNHEIEIESEEVVVLADSSDLNNSVLLSQYIINYLEGNNDSISIHDFLKGLDINDSMLFKPKDSIIENRYHVNFDDDSDLEWIVLYNFYNSSYIGSRILVFDCINNIYELNGSILYCCEGLVSDGEPIIDTVNQVVLLKSRMWGTCEYGYLWNGYRIKNDTLQEDFMLPGFHYASDCSMREKEKLAQLDCSFDFINRDSIEITAKLSAGTSSLKGDSRANQWYYTDFLIRIVCVLDSSNYTYNIYNGKSHYVSSAPITNAIELLEFKDENNLEQFVQ